MYNDISSYILGDKKFEERLGDTKLKNAWVPPNACTHRSLGTLASIRPSKLWHSYVAVSSATHHA